MTPDWNNLKNIMPQFENVDKKINWLVQYSEYDASVVAIQKLIEQAKNFGSMTLNVAQNADTNVYADSKSPSLNKFIENSKQFEFMGTLVNTLNGCVQSCAKVGEVLKLNENKQIDFTSTLRTTVNSFYACANSVKSFWNNVEDLNLEVKNPAIEKVFLNAGNYLFNNAKQLSSMPGVNLDNVDGINSVATIPNDSIIQNGIDTNRQLISTIKQSLQGENSDYLLRQENNVSINLEDTVRSFNMLNQVFDDMWQSRRFDFEQLYSLARNLSHNMEMLCQTEQMLNNNRADQVLDDSKQDQLIDSTIEQNQYDLDSYVCDTVSSMLQTLRMSKENFANISPDFTLDVSRLMDALIANGSQKTTEIRQQLHEAIASFNIEITQPKSTNETKATIQTPSEKANTAPKETVDNNTSKEQESEAKTNTSNIDILSNEDSVLLEALVKDLRKYEWVKNTLLNDQSIKISDRFRTALQTDEIKTEIENMCAKEPPFEYEGELPFVEADKQEIKNIIEHLYKEGFSQDDIVKSTVSEIKNNSSQSLRETWATLSANFNGSHKYFYLAREYLKGISNEVLATLTKENSEGEMTM